MKRFSFGLIALVLLIATNSFAQTGHAVQLDDGLSHYSLIKPTSGALGVIFSLPSVLTNQIFLTQGVGSPTVSNAWLHGGNTNGTGSPDPVIPNYGKIGTLDNVNLDFITNGIGNVRMTLTAAGAFNVNVPTTINTAGNSTIPALFALGAYSTARVSAVFSDGANSTVLIGHPAVGAAAIGSITGQDFHVGSFANPPTVFSSLMSFQTSTGNTFLNVLAGIPTIGRVGASTFLNSTTIGVPNIPTNALNTGVMIRNGGNMSVSTLTFIAGGGTLNFIPKWTPDGFTLGNSRIFDDNATPNITAAANFNPNADVTYALGSAARRWSEVYAGPNSLHVVETAADYGGTGIAEDWAIGAANNTGLAAGGLTFGQSGAEKMRLAPNGVLALGTNNPNSTYGTAIADFASEGFLAPADILIRNAVTSAGYAPGVSIQHARGTLAGNLSVVNGDFLGSFLIAGYDGAGYNTFSTGLDAYVEGVVSPGNVPTKMEFRTSGNVGMTLHSNSTLTINNLPASASTLVVTSNGGILESRSAASLAALTSWVLGGNNAPVSNIFGTTSATDVDMRANNTTLIYLQNATSRVGIKGVPVAGYSLEVFDGAKAGNGAPLVLESNDPIVPMQFSINRIAATRYEINAIEQCSAWRDIVLGYSTGGGGNVPTNIGIGMLPGRKLDVNGTFGTTGNANIGTAAGSAVNIANGGGASNVNIANNSGANNFFGTGNTALNSFGTFSVNNSFGSLSTGVNTFGTGVAATGSNAFGGGSATNTFGGGNPGGPQSNTFGEGVSTNTYTNNIGRSLVAGGTVNTTIGGGAGTSSVAITSGANWSVTAGGAAKFVMPASASTTVVTSNAGVLESRTAASLAAITSWVLGGNAGLTAGTNNQLGTLDATDVLLVSGASGPNTRITISGSNGNVAIGTAVDATNRLELNGNIGFNTAGNKVTNSSTDLTMEQTGDFFGTSRLVLQDRVGSNGALFVQSPNGAHLGTDLVDFGFKPGAGLQSNIRLEARTASMMNPANSEGELEFISNSTGAFSFPFAVGKASAFFNEGVGILVNVPTAALDVNGTARIRTLSGAGTNVVTADVNGNLGSSTFAGLGGVTGTGTANTMTKWTGASTIGNSALTDNGTTLAYGSNVTLATNAGTTNNFGNGGGATVNTIGTAANTNRIGADAALNAFGQASGGGTVNNGFGTAFAAAGSTANNTIGSATAGTTANNTIGSTTGTVTNTILGTTNINIAGAAATHVGNTTNGLTVDNGGITVTAGNTTLTTLTSSGNSTIATNAGTVNTFGNGGGATTNDIGNGGGTTVNTIGTAANTNRIGADAALNAFGQASGGGTVNNGFGTAFAAAGSTANNTIGSATAGTTANNTIGSTTGTVTNTILGTTNINIAGAAATHVGNTTNGLTVDNGGITVTAGITKLSYATVSAGAAIVIPTTSSVIEIVTDGVVAANTITMPAVVAADNGRIIYIHNGDTEATAGTVIAVGATATFVVSGAAWQRVGP